MKLLLTGAAGRLATAIRPALAAQGYAVRLCDRRRVAPRFPGETFRGGRLQSGWQMRRACRDIDAIIHLGGQSVEAGWKRLIRDNVRGLATLLDAARATGVPRLVFASSMHVLGMHSREHPLDAGTEPAPDTRYAVTKLFGEAAGRLYANKYGMCVTCLRIGHAVESLDEAVAGAGITFRDLARLIVHALERQEGGYRLVTAIAPAAGAMPQPDAFDYQDIGPARAVALELAASDERLGPAARLRHGGNFVELP